MKKLLLILLFFSIHIGSTYAQFDVNDSLSANDEQPPILEMRVDSGVFKVDKIIHKRSFYIIHMSNGENRIKVLSSKKNKPQEILPNMIRLRKGCKYQIKTTSCLYFKNMMPNLNIRIEYENSIITQYSGRKWFDDICAIDGLKGLYIDKSALVIFND